MSMQIKLGVTSCPECKEEVHKDANICPHCQTKLSEHPEWIKKKEQGGGCLILIGFVILSGASAAIMCVQPWV